jgi:hypothetical protein
MFENKEWKKLTEEDIQRVYDDLEDGKIKNRKGSPSRISFLIIIKSSNQSLLNSSIKTISLKRS